jgi:hypothetical protein
MRSRSARALVGALISVVVFATPGTASGGVAATLDGRAITLQRAGTLSCHDRDYPVLRCFSTPNAMRLDLVSRAPRGSASPYSVTVGDLYVIAFEHSAYAGSAMGLTADQPWLSSVGWNDRISSFKSFGVSGNFRENSPASGFFYTFGPTAQVAYVGSTYNDKFSAFYMN